jgi:hypothetical protein
MMDPGERFEANTGYASGQLARAFETALASADVSTKARAQRRIRQWSAVLAGMQRGELVVGSRTPIGGFPAWVTPTVERGGFATPHPAAGGPLEPRECALAESVGVASTRSALFAWYLTDEGLAVLNRMLDDGKFAVLVPENAALLVVAWLLRAGDSTRALDLLDEVRPFADRLRFVPYEADGFRMDPEVLFRESAGQAAKLLESRVVNPRVEAMREALQIWNPFADELLDLWTRTIEDGAVGATFPDGWSHDARGLLERYAVLKVEHPRCSKHRNPKENLAILLSATKSAVEQSISSRERGRAQTAVDGMLRKRGLPGSDTHTRVRSAQAQNAEVPAHSLVAAAVAGRFRRLRPYVGVADPESLLGPIGGGEGAAFGLRAGTAVPPSVARIGRRTLAGPIELLVDREVVPSAEVLARLVPSMTANTIAETYADEALRRVVFDSYLASRRRRSLLLLNLEHQVGLDDLPWMEAISAHATDLYALRSSGVLLVRLAELVVASFPETIIPNSMIRELDAVAVQAGLRLPFTEELAADIFMGTFSIKFLRAAETAASLLQGSLYERYYSVNYAQLLQSTASRSSENSHALVRTSSLFDKTCRERAGIPTDHWSVAANGAIIEQAQILTTHNLATLAGPVGLAESMQSMWPALAERCFARVCELVDRLENNPRPLRTVKGAAYAWRQMIFFLSIAPDDDKSGFVSACQQSLARRAGLSASRLRPAIAGLELIASGGAFDPLGQSEECRRFLGWTVGRHWMLDTQF